jgi:hypothetical protein
MQEIIPNLKEKGRSESKRNNQDKKGQQELK